MNKREAVYFSRRGRVLWVVLAIFSFSVLYTVVRAPYMPDPAAYIQASAYFVSPICFIIAAYMGGKSWEKSNAIKNGSHSGGSSPTSSPF